MPVFPKKTQKATVWRTIFLDKDSDKIWNICRINIIGRNYIKTGCQNSYEGTDIRGQKVKKTSSKMIVRRLLGKDMLRVRKEILLKLLLSMTIQVTKKSKLIKTNKPNVSPTDAEVYS